MAKKRWRVGKRKCHATGEDLFFVDGPQVVQDYEDWGYTEPDARLMAAAVDMRDALIASRDNYGRYGRLANDPYKPGELISKINNALEKAGVTG